MLAVPLSFLTFGTDAADAGSLLAPGCIHSVPNRTRFQPWRILSAAGAALLLLPFYAIFS